jgi:zinc/manganese transport system substrate-binding protein
LRFDFFGSGESEGSFAEATLVILNGSGYDDWGKKLLAANPSSSRQVLNIADLLGKKVGDNPHFWYNPDYVVRIADKITDEYKTIAAGDASFFDQQRAQLAGNFLPYLNEITTIYKLYHNAPIGSTESIFVYMATALGLNLTTPVEFMDAVAEGNDPPAAAVATFQNQISANQIKVLVYNVQTTTAVTTNIKALAATHHIPSVGVSETPQPEKLSFQDWQLKQLQSLEAALKSTS